ncbi:MAG: prepilin-type N-terminal cleavage/methylation domain-containing protein [Verrucomicrobiota bacterium]
MIYNGCIPAVHKQPMTQMHHYQHSITIHSEAHQDSITRRPNRLRAFTLIEILVVVVIIGILAGLAIPVVGKVMTEANKSADLSNLRQLYLIAQNVANESAKVHPDSFIYWDRETHDDFIKQEAFGEILRSKQWSKQYGGLDKRAFTVNSAAFPPADPSTPGYKPHHRGAVSPVLLYSQQSRPLYFHGVRFSDTHGAFAWGGINHVSPVYSKVDKPSPDAGIQGKAAFLFTNGSARMVDTSQETLEWESQN